MASDITSTINATGRIINSWASLAEYQVFANLSSPSAQVQSQITEALIDAKVWIESQLDRQIVSGSNNSATETFRGNDSQYYVPKEGPILSITTVEQWNGTEYEEVDSTTMVALTDSNWIYFQDGNRFVPSVIPLNWRITYTFGFGTIPRDLKRASMMLTERFVSSEQRTRLQSESDGEQSFSYWIAGADKIIEDVMKIVMQYKRYPTRGN